MIDAPSFLPSVDPERLVRLVLGSLLLVLLLFGGRMRDRARRRRRAAARLGDEEIATLVRARVEAKRAPGLVVGVIREDGTRAVFAAGVTRRGGAPVDGRTLFEIGSVSKPVTALLLADAVLRGEVRLDQPVAELLPEGARITSHPDGPVTLEALATHRSGLPRLPDDLEPVSGDDPYAEYDERRLLEFLASHRPRRAPGRRYEYSNLGYGLLGWLLARGAGAGDWGTLVLERIAAPLGMEGTVVAAPVAAPLLDDHVATGHDATMRPVPFWRFDALAGAGALRSTAEDMLRFLAAQLHVDGAPLGPAAAMTHEPRAKAGLGTRIGLGWHIMERDGRTIHWHDGGTGGFSSFAAFDRARGTAVIVLANAAVDVDDLGLEIMNQMAGSRE